MNYIYNIEKKIEPFSLDTDIIMQIVSNDEETFERVMNVFEFMSSSEDGLLLSRTPLYRYHMFPDAGTDGVDKEILVIPTEYDNGTEYWENNT